jgi:hypothetical protein
MTNDLKLIKQSLQRISDSHNQILPKTQQETPHTCPMPLAEAEKVIHSSSEQDDLGQSLNDIHEVTEANEVSEISDITSRNFPIKGNPKYQLNRPQKVQHQRNQKMQPGQPKNFKQAAISLNSAQSGQINVKAKPEIIERAREQIKRIVGRRPSGNSGATENSSRDKYFRRLISLEQTVESGAGANTNNNRDLTLNSGQKHAN